MIRGGIDSLRVADINTFPVDVLSEIFSKFSERKDLGKIALVCKKWHELIDTELNKPISKPSTWKALSFQRITIINQAVWENLPGFKELNVSFEAYGAMCLTKRSYLHIGKQVEEVKIKEGLGITYLVIPKGIDIAKLEKIGKGRIEFNIGNPVKSSCDSFVTTKVTQILITDSNLEGTYRSSYDDQQNTLKKLKATTPNLLNILAHIVLSEVVFSKKVYYGPKYSLLVQCAELHNDCYPIVFFRTPEEKEIIISWDTTNVIRDPDLADSLAGVGAQWLIEEKEV